MPPASFTRFNQLPAEIRTMIWRLSWEPRVVDVEYDVVGWSHPDMIVKSTAVLPPTLFVCSESRAETRKAYIQPFLAAPLAREAQLYLHPDIDMLCLPPFFLAFAAKEIAKFFRDTMDRESVLLKTYHSPFGADDNLSIYEMLRLMPGLQTLYFFEPYLLPPDPPGAAPVPKKRPEVLDHFIIPSGFKDRRIGGRPPRLHGYPVSWIRTTFKKVFKHLKVEYDELIAEPYSP